MELFEHLRAATRPAHDAIENLPAARAMISGTISRSDYVATLGRAYWVHDTFERAVASHAVLAEVWPEEAARAAAIARDLESLDAEVPQRPTPSVESWAERIRERAATEPSVWGGVGYVLEGSRMGSRMLVGPVARALGVEIAPGTGVDYHREGLDDPGGRWRRVREAIAALDRLPFDRGAIVYGAIATFGVMSAVHGGPGLPAETVPVLATSGALR